MSYNQRQVDSSKTESSSMSYKTSNKRPLAPPSTITSSKPNTPSPSKNGALKAKPPSTLSTSSSAPNSVVYSQPADTGTGRFIMTQVTYAVEHLKKKEVPRTLAQIVDHLSVDSQSSTSRRSIAHILKRHDRVEFTPSPTSSGVWDSGSYRFRPIHNIRSADELLASLQSARSFQGLSVRELKEGWSGADSAISLLEGRNQILVTRNKKDGHARMVWANDASLTQNVDEDFRAMWQKIKLPSKDDLPGELVKLGHKPTSADPSDNKGNKHKVAKQKKKRGGVGRTTNTHMLGVLRDYSHLKR